MGILGEVFAWWGGNTWGTRWTVWKHGRLVGTDELGNRYYQQRSGEGPHGKPRRWVIYRDLSEASQVPPEWHGWLHHTFEEPPTEEDYTPQPWQKPHRMNMTGSSAAYRPPGSILTSAERPKATGDYTPWRPD
ncbi:MAG: NADH:ubiquinone oxidoreductase subunit NDUFA12 [Hyphomicrobiaceae bacterium]